MATDTLPNTLDIGIKCCALALARAIKMNELQSTYSIYKDTKATCLDELRTEMLINIVSVYGKEVGITFDNYMSKMTE